MPKIKLAKMTKRLNSISRTLLAATSPITVRLKESTSIHSPVFILENQNAFDNDYNYIVLLDENENPKFYYWVEDKVAVTNNITEWHCSLDPLATYHDQILHTTAFLSYADEDHWDPLLDDPRLAPDCEVKQAEWVAEGTQTSKPYTNLPLKRLFRKPNLNDLTNEASWTVFVTVCGTQVSNLQNPLYGFSGCTVYAMPMSLYRVVMEKNSNTVVTTVGDFFDDLSLNPFENLKAVYEAMSRTLCTIFDGGVPLDNILSVMAVPISFYDVLCFPRAYDPNEGSISDQYNDDIWEQTDKMLIGSFPVDLSDVEQYVYKAANLWLSGNLTDIYTNVFTIPFLKCTERYKFLRLPKYTKVTVYHPCGQADISDKTFENNDICAIEGSVDVFNGLYTVNVNSSHPIPDCRVVTNLSGNLGYDFAWYNKMGEKTDALKIQDDARGALLNLTSSICGVMSKVNFNSPEFSQTKTVAKPKNDVKNDKSNAATLISASTGIAGDFQPSSQTSSTREFNSSGSLLNCFLCRTDDNGKLLFTCSVEHFFPSIFMDERSGHEGMCYLDNNKKAIRYEAFCKEYGYVCNKRLMLSECFDEEHNPAKTCFVKAEGASFYPDSTTTCTPSVISTINSFLNSGIYLEK